MLILIQISTSISVIFNCFRSLWLSNEVSRAQRSLSYIPKGVRGRLFYKGYVFTNFGLSLSTVRAFSTYSIRRNYSSTTNSISLVVFNDADKDKLDILKFIKGRRKLPVFICEWGGKHLINYEIN